MSGLFDLTGKTAVVTGGTSTLGSVMAEGMAEHGCSIAIVCRSLEKAAPVVAAIEAKGVKAKAFCADVTEMADLERSLEEIINWGGDFDILLNTPGKNSPTPFFELSMDEWDDIMNVNLKGLVMTCQVYGRRMVDFQKPGSIINISSVSSDPPLSRVFTYSASKAGVNNVTQFLARELAQYGIRVNAIIPGFFPAEQNREILAKDPARVEAIMKHTPLARFGDAEELQGTAVWLASEKASSFVTGALIRVDGGFGAMTI